ncbi:MAG: hypothetical protein JWN49_264 [Parcubacteria group bacterium]|nr:hypothetical protein [Parcubacteria group bacterium]
MNIETPTSSNKKTKLCPHCKQEVNPRATRCPHCAGKLWVWSTTNKFIYGGIGLILLFWLIGTFGDYFASPSASSVPIKNPIVLTVGQAASLHLPGNDDPTQAICLAPNLALYREYSNALDRRDFGAILPLADKGLFCVHNGSKVKVLETNSVYSRVQVVSGVAEIDKDKIGESGWSVTEWLSPI